MIGGIVLAFLADSILRFETARISYLRGLGIHDPVAEVEAGFGLIFAECHISYRAPVQSDLDLDVALTICDIRRSSFRIAFEMRVGERLNVLRLGQTVGGDRDGVAGLAEHRHPGLTGQDPQLLPERGAGVQGRDHDGEPHPVLRPCRHAHRTSHR